MKVRQQTTTRRSATRRSVAATAPASGWTAALPVTDMVRGLDRSIPMVTARVPGRLDVMGGSAAHTGGFALGAIIEGHAYCVAQRRTDGRIVITLSTTGNGGNPSPITMTVADVAQGSGDDCFDRTALADDEGAIVARCVVAGLQALLRSGAVADLGGGVSIVVATTIPTPGDLGTESALLATVTLASASVFDATLDAADLPSLLISADDACACIPVCASDLSIQTQGGSTGLSQVDGLARSGITSLSLPKGTVVVGVNCGLELAGARERFEQMRTAACMGRAIIARIIRHENLDHLGWEGRLSRIASTDYVERFRDRIPTKLIGARYIEHFGEQVGGVGRVEPDKVYRVRSRTEHHIYEHERSLRFGECIARAARTGDPAGLQAAGKLMYGSHWSYGQRCGLGSIETDRLVNLLRRHGGAAGIWGAKSSGRGCGGVVAVLMDGGGAAKAALQSAMRDFQQQARSQPTLVALSEAGGEFEGVRRI